MEIRYSPLNLDERVFDKEGEQMTLYMPQILHYYTHIHYYMLSPYQPEKIPKAAR